VQPVIVTLVSSSADGGTVVTVTNEGRSELSFDFYVGDFDQDEDGEHGFFDAGSHARSCAERITVLPNGATLAPGERRQIQIRLRPGTETCWSLLFVESAVRTAGGARVGQRIGVKVYGVPEGAPAVGELTKVEASTDGQSIDLEFENTGLGPLRPEGRLEIRSFAGVIMRTVEIEPFSVLPEHRRRLTVQFGEPLPAGRYVAVPILDYGGEYLAGGQATFEVLTNGASGTGSAR
jgi:hypothetical protein